MPVGFFPTNPAVGQAIGNYNQGISAETIARMQADAAIQQAQLNARAQQAQLQQQGQQQAQVNALRQQEMQQQGAYQQAVLGNQRAQTAAQMEWQKALMGANAAEAEKDRLSNETIAGTMYGNINKPDPSKIQIFNNAAESAASRYDTMLDLEKKSAEQMIHDQIKKDASKWFTFQGGAEKAAAEALSALKAGNYLAQTKSVLDKLALDPEAKGAIFFDGTKFRAKRIGPAASAPTSFNNPAAKASPDVLLKEAADAIAEGANPVAVNERLSKFGLSLPSLPQIAPSPLTLDATDAPVQPGFFNAPSAPTRGATALDRTITVRTSDGKVRTGPESAWPKLKAEDPGAEIISAPPPKVAPPTAGSFFQTSPGSPAPNWMMQRMFGQ